MKPIVLTPLRSKFRFPNPANIPPGLYESVHGTIPGHPPDNEIPPLAYFCIRKLVHYPDQLYTLGPHRIRCQPQVLRALSPSTFGDDNSPTRCLCKLDPRLWSIIVQVYSDLPRGLQNYSIPLGDKHLPLLQAIPSTPSFALITVLNLARCVSDETSHVLKLLHGLCALDISDTPISHLGIRHFAPMATTEPPDPHYGTRGLRILRLNNCREITNHVIDVLPNFPLLTIIDLRGASCTHELNPEPFHRSKKGQYCLFQCSLQDALQRLSESDSRNILFSHPDPFIIHISTQFHPQLPNRPKPAPAPLPPLLPPHRHQDSQFAEAERELREWTSSILGDATNETRISELASFVMQRWEYKWLEPDGGPDSGFPWEDNDSIESWDECSSTVSPLNFCGYHLDRNLVESVRRLADKAQEEHESTIRFYGPDSRTPKTVDCHCRELRGTTTSPAEIMPADPDYMLVRDPPSWDFVYGPGASAPQRIKLTRMPPRFSSSSLNPGWSNVRVEKYTLEVLRMLPQRRSLPTPTLFPAISSTTTLSKNPFRKTPTKAQTHKELNDLHHSTWGGNSDLVRDSPTPKRMKSISQIPVPPRPMVPTISQSTRVNNEDAPKATLKKSSKLKQTTLSEMFAKRA